MNILGQTDQIIQLMVYKLQGWSIRPCLVLVSTADSSKFNSLCLTTMAPLGDHTKRIDRGLSESRTKQYEAEDFLSLVDARQSHLENERKHLSLFINRLVEFKSAIEFSTQLPRDYGVVKFAAIIGLSGTNVLESFRRGTIMK